MDERANIVGDSEVLCCAQGGRAEYLSFSFILFRPEAACTITVEVTGGKVGMQEMPPQGNFGANDVPSFFF